ncbi:Hypothetical_protein [Hexamita inflata]|uniref:Hypothetical_protein n=1 Tax=Hexamita inflata TaxID=28002 RepID=A0AA86UBX9_9EUKA|nr:Hypothetical protein HINF_LOCUS39450 [Hexamita inflata]
MQYLAPVKQTINIKAEKELNALNLLEQFCKTHLKIQPQVQFRRSSETSQHVFTHIKKQTCKEPPKKSVTIDKCEEFLIVKSFGAQKPKKEDLVYPTVEQERKYNMRCKSHKKYVEQCLEEAEQVKIKQAEKSEAEKRRNSENHSGKLVDVESLFKPKQQFAIQYSENEDSTTSSQNVQRRTVYSRQASAQLLETVDDINFVDDFEVY